ncbi:YdcF family protein [Candidatus Liberibacter brunswickensis]|uniref:YdcF family protein n=1 Tax=Candidatus Liberibacter brunswickensis TaxID=1968796 RepID=UPI002FE0D3B3
MGSCFLLFFFIGFGFIPKILLENLQFSYEITLLSPQWNEDSNIIVLLGNGTTITPIHNKVDIRPSPTSYSRIFETLRLYNSCKKHSKHCKIIISGGDPQKHGLSESIVYSNKLLEMNVDIKDIINETKSLNTFQNAQFSSKIIKEMNGKNIIIVSSAYHLKRSKLYFQYLGINTKTSCSDYINASYSIVPMSINFYLTELALKEYIGILISYYRGKTL